MVTRQEILSWLLAGAFYVRDGHVYTRQGRQLAQRINKRRGCEHGDARVDLFHAGKRKSIHVSHLVWMSHTKTVIPEGFEVHHRNEDPLDNAFENLVVVHWMDHNKLHAGVNEEVPF